MNRIAGVLGWGLLGLLGLAAVVLTAWSVLGLLGLVPAPAPGGKTLTPTDLASMAVAGATLLLATVTVFLAVFTGRSLALTRAELVLTETSLKAFQDQAVATQAQAAAMQSQVGATQAQAAAIQNQVAATQEQAAIARQTMEASWRPLLVDVPWELAQRSSAFQGKTDAAEIDINKTQEGDVTVEVPLRNIGAGPAIITKAGLSVGQLHAEATNLSTAIVAPDQIVRATFKIKTGTPTANGLISALSAQEPFVVTVFYGDQGGTGSWRSRIYIHRPPNYRVYVVERMEIYAGDETTPIASTLPQ